MLESFGGRRDRGNPWIRRMSLGFLVLGYRVQKDSVPQDLRIDTLAEPHTLNPSKP